MRGIVDLGTVYEAESGSAHRVQSGPLRRHRREIVQFLGSFVPGDEPVESIASRITGGRIGMRPNVAGVKYFKENKELWSQWIDQEDRGGRSGKPSTGARPALSTASAFPTEGIKTASVSRER